MYQLDVGVFPKAFYDLLERMPMPDSVESIISSFKENQIALFPSDSTWVRLTGMVV